MVPNRMGGVDYLGYLFVPKAPLTKIYLEILKTSSVNKTQGTAL
jgi:hypothetical protein